MNSLEKWYEIKEDLEYWKSNQKNKKNDTPLFGRNNQKKSISKGHF